MVPPATRPDLRPKREWVVVGRERRVIVGWCWLRKVVENMGLERDAIVERERKRENLKC